MHVVIRSLSIGSNHRLFQTLDNDEVRPYLQRDTFAAPTATVIGYVLINHFTVLLPNCVIRGDLAHIFIGAYCLIEDDVVISAGSVANPSADVNVEDYSQVGAGSVLRSCTIQRFCTVGNGCVIEESVFMGEGSVLEPKSVRQ